MNKLFLLSAAGVLCLATGTQAQQLRQHSLVANGYDKGAVAAEKPTDAGKYVNYVGGRPVLRIGNNAKAKGAGATFYTQTFGSGIPAGWTTASTGTSGRNGWRAANAAPANSGTVNQYYISAINSTTAANGWLLYNADSVLNTPSTLTGAFSSSITSAPISCTGHSAVSISFQQYFRRGGSSTAGATDSCFVDVSSNGTTFTTFPVWPNNTLSQYQYLSTNPTYNTINISSVAANQPNVYIRFRYSTAATTYAFNWEIDDVTLADADPVDLGLARSGIVSDATSQNSFTNSYGFTSIPLQFADTVFPIAFVSNFGNTNNTNVTVTARYYNGSTQVATAQTVTLSNSAINGIDSTVIFNTGFKPTTSGNYTVAISISPTNDAVATNNVDTIRFSVTDSVYASYGNSISGGVYFYRPGSGTSLISDYRGARFTIGDAKKDTVTSCSVAIYPLTGSAGQKIQCQIYKATDDGSGNFSWNPVAATVTRTLTTADVTASTSGSVNFVSIPMAISKNDFSPLILDDGDYTVAVTTVNATAGVAIYTAYPPFAKAPSYIGYQGQLDDSPNDGTTSFASASGTGIRTGTIEVPVIRANFGNAKALVTTVPPKGIANIAGISLGDAFPNPANTALYIPITVMANAANVMVTLSNIVGQSLLVEKLGNLSAGQQKMAKISTADLAQGTYLYTVEANGERFTSKITVAH